MAATYSAGQSSESWGLASVESGILIDSLTESVSNPKEFLLDESGSRKGFAYDIHAQADVSISGEVNGTIGTTGLLQYSFGAAVTISNELLATQYGMSGDLWLDSVNVSQGRQSWQTFSATYNRWPNVT